MGKETYIVVFNDKYHPYIELLTNDLEIAEKVLNHELVGAAWGKAWDEGKVEHAPEGRFLCKVIKREVWDE